MRILLVSLLGCLSLVSGVAQEAAPLRYDVVTVKESKSTEPITLIDSDSGDMLKVENSSLMTMLTVAFDLHEYLIEGAPKWGQSKHFDVQGKILDATPDQIKALTEDQRRAMFVAVLEDRFHLKTHWETRDKPEYELVVAKGGSRLKESTAKHPSSGLNWDGMDAEMQSSGDLAKTFAFALEKPVVDKTGLTGRYDVTLKWAPLRGKPDPSPSEDIRPDIFTVVKESLGLELKPTHGPVKVLVVDSAEEPSLEN
ncbi:TIGR03435 family protein [Silvibacterium dinghuense]|uniref:TIGR03435 family protein n=1 Tax=Silvibacterium dinghuense TaxID=1560006 RepID=A0A4Q1S9Z8_9BACT|nr:TIGR03435 family protein [Silvibacterium dinghuense]RXS93755.1 TIGR03435 family protein [Silvibacterium dinghuense]GGH07348.1 hypothetical protein GCM10011586_24570 [Silvibacterium dinghuense]